MRLRSNQKRTKVWALVMMCLLVGSLLPGVGAQEMKGMETIIPSLSVTGIDIREVLTLLAGYSGINFNASKEVKGPVTVELADVTVRDVLDIVLKDNGFNYIESESGIVRILTQAQYDKEMKKKPPVEEKRYIPTYVTVEDFQSAFRPLLSKDGKITVIKSTKTVVVQDVAEVHAKISSMLPLIDVQLLTRVFRIENGDASEIQKQLETALDIKRGQAILDKERNILILTTTQDNLEKAAKIIAEFDEPLEMEVFKIQFADPEEISSLLKPILSKEGYLEMHEQTNSVIVRDIAARVEVARQLIAEIDIPPKAVWIEAEIVNVNMDRDFQLGINWRLGQHAAPYTVDATSSGVLTSDQSAFTEAFVGLLNGNLSYYDFGGLGSKQLATAITAMENNSIGNLMSSPRVMVINDEEADLNVGAEEPFSVRQRRTTSTGDDDIFTQRTRRVGITLTVTPHIIDAGYVNMEVYMEDSNADRVDIGNGDIGLRVNQRTMDTVVLVKDGRTVGLGGLISRSESKSKTGVPFISKIPILGLPFRNTTEESERRKLLLFITPHIVNTDDPYQKYQIDDSTKNRMYKQDGIYGWQDQAANEDEDNPDRWYYDLPQSEREVYQSDEERSKSPVLIPGDYDEKGVFWTPGKSIQETPPVEQPASLDGQGEKDQEGKFS